MTPEGKVKQALKKRLDELGAYHFWPVQTGYGNRTLDCLGCYRRKFFAVETKRPGEKPTALQELTIESMKAAGGKVFVIDNLEIARAFTFGSDFET